MLKVQNRVCLTTPNPPYQRLRTCYPRARHEPLRPIGRAAHVQGETMVERPLHRTPTCLSGEWDAVQDRAPQGGPSLSTAIACGKGVRSRVALQPHPSMWGEDAPPLAEGELGQANSNLGGT